MTEHEEFEMDELPDPWDDDSDDPDDPDDRVAEIVAEIVRWEEETGIELSAEDFNRVGTMIDLYQMSPDQAYADTEPGRFEADFEATVQAVENEQGRKLLDSEVDAMWEAAQRASSDPSVETNAQIWAAAKQEAATLDSPHDVAEYIAARLAVEPEREQASGVQVDDDDNELPSFNLDNRDEQAAAIDALMAGEAVATHDNNTAFEGDDD